MKTIKKKNTSTRNAGLVTFFLFVRFNHIEKVGLVSVCECVFECTIFVCFVKMKFGEASIKVATQRV